MTAARYPELFRRSVKNPILSADDWPYGAADTSIALATASIAALLDWLAQSGRPAGAR